ASHGPKYFGVEPENTMDKMIYVFDELSGFIHASALIRPTRYEGMDVKGILKKLKTPSFAAQVSRDDISDAISRIDTPLEEIIQFIIDHQKEVEGGATKIESEIDPKPFPALFLLVFLVTEPV